MEEIQSCAKCFIANPIFFMTYSISSDNPSKHPKIPSPPIFPHCVVMYPQPGWGSGAPGVGGGGGMVGMGAGGGGMRRPVPAAGDGRGLEAFLRGVDVTPEAVQLGGQAMLGWQRLGKAQEATAIWEKVALSSGAYFPMLYVANEVVHHSRHLGTEYLGAMCFSIPRVLAAAARALPAQVSGLSRLVNIWEQQSIYSSGRCARWRDLIAEPSRLSSLEQEAARIRGGGGETAGGVGGSGGGGGGGMGVGSEGSGGVGGVSGGVVGMGSWDVEKDKSVAGLSEWFHIPDGKSRVEKASVREVLDDAQFRAQIAKQVSGMVSRLREDLVDGSFDPHRSLHSPSLVRKTQLQIVTAWRVFQLLRLCANEGLELADPLTKRMRLEATKADAAAKEAETRASHTKALLDTLEKRARKAQEQKTKLYVTPAGQRALQASVSSTSTSATTTTTTTTTSSSSSSSSSSAPSSSLLALMKRIGGAGKGGERAAKRARVDGKGSGGGGGEGEEDEDDDDDDVEMSLGSSSAAELALVPKREREKGKREDGEKDGSLVWNPLTRELDYVTKQDVEE